MRELPTLLSGQNEPGERHRPLPWFRLAHLNMDRNYIFSNLPLAALVTNFCGFLSNRGLHSGQQK